MLRIFFDTIQEIDARSALDILLFAAIIFTLLLLLRGTTAMSLLRGGVIIFAAVSGLAYSFDLELLKWLISTVVKGLFVAVPIIFQAEIRRTLERVGRTRVTSLRTRPAMDALIDAIAIGSGDLSKRRHGALMVIERETGLQDYMGTGQRIDAIPSPDLLSNIFYRNSPLHDGALIIRGDRIAAAGCTLPLSEAPMEGHTGTRHRAGIGITERTDAVSVIVSEETGDISVASNGRMVSKLDEGRLRDLLAGLLGSDDGTRRGRFRRERSVGLLGASAGSEVAG
ncbi:MAG: TIGR00159 family protein [Chloroflexi bacterium]|nr:TIGR00159 family protein [Chloroflexota bacterium]